MRGDFFPLSCVCASGLGRFFCVVDAALTQTPFVSKSPRLVEGVGRCMGFFFGGLQHSAHRGVNKYR